MNPPPFPVSALGSSSKLELPSFATHRATQSTPHMTRRTGQVGALWLLLGALVPGLVAQPYTPPANPRAELSLDFGWRFIRQDVASAQAPAFDDSGWTAVDLPHTWNNLDGQDGGSNYYRGAGWYRRHYTLGSEYAGRRLFLKFDGANILSDVWVNGSYVGQHQGGFAAFVFDVTTNLNIGADNVIAVKVDNSSSLTNVPPLSADFTFFGGLYRDVHLLVTDAFHITPLDYGSPGVYLQATSLTSNFANLQVTALVSNASAAAKSLTVREIVTDAATNIVTILTHTLFLPSASLSNVAATAVVPKPHLWNGLVDPYLYRVYVEVMDGTNVADLVSQPLGFRWFSIDPTNGFFLNGRYYDLHGASMHQDWLNRGWAIGNAERLTNFALLKEIGATAMRLSHYQHNEHTYQLADQNGIVLWTEVPLINSVTATPEFTTNVQQQLRELIRQNCNHPSVVCWGLFNEESVSATNVVSPLATLARQEDPTRPSAAASNQGDSAALNWIADIVAFNKYYGWYSGTTNNFGSWADAIHAKYPTRCIGVSEYGAGASIYQHVEEPVPQSAPDARWHPEEWQNLFHEAHWNQMKSRPFLWCKFVWNMFDFGVDARNEGDTAGRNDKGLVTYDRQVRKDAFFWYKANWTTNPMVYITGHTFTNRQAFSITARVYANCDSVQLWLNGVSQGSAASTNRLFTWPLTLVAGSNFVTAVGTKGATNVTDSLIWTLQPQPYRGAPLSLPGRLQAEEFDSGPESLAYHDTTPANTGGAYRTNDAVDIENCTDLGYGYDVTGIAPGEWLNYSVSVASSGYYDAQFRLAGTNSGKTLRLRFDGADLAGNIAVPNTGGTQVWQTVTVTNLLLSAGPHALRLETDTGGFNFNWMTFAFRPAPGAFALKINFQTASAAVPAGYLKDTGLVFANRTNGYSYGWNLDDSANTRERSATNSPDERYDTLIHMQKGGTNCTFVLAVPNGRYTVYAVSGDPGYTDSFHSLTAEALPLLSGAPASDRVWIEGATEVVVSDGRLTIDNATNGNNNKICFLDVAETLGASQGWRFARFGTNCNNLAIAGDSADPDGDGLSNLLEYAFNTDPLAANANHPWQATLKSGHLTLTYPRRKPPTDISYYVEAADSLDGPWTNSPTQLVITDDGTMQTIKATDLVSTTDAPQRFLRLRITRP